MVKQTSLNLVLISFICAFGVSLGALVLMLLAGAPTFARGPVFVIGTAVLSYFFFRTSDIKLVLSYSLVALGILFVLFPAFMYLGMPNALPDRNIIISPEQAFLIILATGFSSLVLAVALLRSPLKSK
ncbi:MAG: hypothetical protein ABIF01_03240 [Candidatus Micrarchaeota archaeon]